MIILPQILVKNKNICNQKFDKIFLILTIFLLFARMNFVFLRGNPSKNCIHVLPLTQLIHKFLIVCSFGVDGLTQSGRITMRCRHIFIINYYLFIIIARCRQRREWAPRCWTTTAGSTALFISEASSRYCKGTVAGDCWPLFFSKNELHEFA